MSTKRILITGAGGFVGRAVAMRLAEHGAELTFAVRRAATSAVVPLVGRQVAVGDIACTTDWSEALRDCDVVVHIAGQVPARGVRDERFRIVNDEATGVLARQAANAGVERFVFLSSVATIVAHNAATEIVSDDTAPNPVSAYGRSKLAGERRVADFAASRPGRTGISIRPPMAYGAAARGSWGKLQKLAATRMPLPFGSVNNRRSSVSLKNLADAVAAAALAGEDAPSGAFVVADAQPLSLADMVRLLREGMGLPPRLVPFPPVLLSAPPRLIGKGATANSLMGDLVIDGGRFRAAFNWTPPEQAAESMRRSGMEYMAARRG